VRVYFFVKAKWAVNDIRERRLKVCRFFDLNDPFELFAGEQRDKAFRKRMRGWAEEINEQDGLLCFGSSWTNPLMWSHYADRHKGICLGFDVDDSIVERIDYRPQRLRLDEWKTVALTQPPKTLRQALLTTKFARWKYEEERRVISPLVGLVKEGDLFFRRFDRALRLVKVIAGARCCVGWKPLIKSAIINLHPAPKLLKARLAFRTFAVVPQKLAGSAEQGFESDSTWRECVCTEPHDPQG
jgi:hypothetical protein